MVVTLAAFVLGAVLAAVALEVARARRRCTDGAAWLAVANANELLRADLDNLAGDDPNHGLRGLRLAISESAARRPGPERALLDRFNGLLGVAIAFGEKVHDAGGELDMRAVAMRREHVRNALRLGERIEYALGGIGQVARDAQVADVLGEGSSDRRLRRRRGRLPEASAAPVTRGAAAT